MKSNIENFSEVRDSSKTYWDMFYAENSLTHRPSSFAEFCLPQMDKLKYIVELGCGNGRDACYFAQNNLKVIAFDRSHEAIVQNQKMKIQNIEFIEDDFTAIKSEYIVGKEIGNIYSRFTLHSIDKTDFDRTLEWVSETLLAGGKFFLEARTINDKLFGVGKAMPDNGFYTTHYRRFLDIKQVKVQLENLNFTLLYCVEDFISAELNNDGAVVLRVICIKK